MPIADPCRRESRRLPRRVLRALRLAVIIGGLLCLQLAPWHAADHLAHADLAGCGICQIAQHAGAPRAHMLTLAPLPAESFLAQTRPLAPRTARRRSHFARAPPRSS